MPAQGMAQSEAGAEVVVWIAVWDLAQNLFFAEKPENDQRDAGG